MTEPWIGTCTLRALTQEKRRWDGDTDIGEGLLIAHATDAKSYEAAIKAAIEAKGYALEAVREASSVKQSSAYVTHRTEIDQSSWQLQEKGLLLINGFHPVVGHNPYQETTWDALMANGADPLWAVIDGVNWPEASNLLEGRSDAACLYATQDADTKAAAPWLVQVTKDSPVTALLKSRAHDTYTGILFQSHWSLSELRKHLRKFTMVWTPANPDAPIYFRFYDPRVLLDMSRALEPANWAIFTAPFTSLALPIAPLTLLPRQSDVPHDPFAKADSFQNRIVSIKTEGATSSSAQPKRSFQISQAELEAFDTLHASRGSHKIAISLYDMFQASHTAQDCLSAAKAAPKEGALFGFHSVRQMQVMALCLLQHGDAFWTQHEDARDILTNSKLLPWQKKDALYKWHQGQMFKRTRSKAS